MISQSPAVIEHGDVLTKIRHYNQPLEELAGYETPTEMYENGDVIVADSLDLPMQPEDWDFIKAIDLPPTLMLAVQKAREYDLMLPVTAAGFPKHVLSYYFPGDLKKAVRFQQIMERVNKRVRRHVTDLFPCYDIVQEHITWRFTRTENEAIHFDSYAGNANDYHNVRIFVNLDDKPRLWGVSHKVPAMIEKYPHLASLHDGEHPNLFNNVINKNVPWHEVPRHFVAFAPGNAWLVNSQLVSHEIIFGRKLLACVFSVDPKSMRREEDGFVFKSMNAVEKHK